MDNVDRAAINAEIKQAANVDIEAFNYATATLLGMHQGAQDIIERLRGKVDAVALLEAFEAFQAIYPLRTPTNPATLKIMGKI